MSRLLAFCLLCQVAAESWRQVGQDVDGEVDENSESGVGDSIAMCRTGRRIAIGAWANSADKGRVRVYEQDGGRWAQLGEDLVGASDFDRFGGAVAMNSDGSRLAVGANGRDDGGDMAGQVRVYAYGSGLAWMQVGNSLDGEGSNDWFGLKVALSADGSTLAASARKGGGSNTMGRVRIYKEVNGSWVQMGNNLDGVHSQDNFGVDLALSADGRKVAIGSDTHDSSKGHVRVFAYEGSDWVQMGGDLDGEVPFEQLGSRVAISDDGLRVAAAAPFNDQRRGQVRVYEYQDNGWVQLGADLTGEEAGDLSGVGVALNGDGSLVAIGAPFNAGSGAQSGHVRVYSYDGEQWVQVGSDLDGESAGDKSGSTVALSADGSRIAIGAPSNDDSGSREGHVRIFEFPLPTTTTTEAFIPISGASAVVYIKALQLLIASVMMFRV